MFWFIVMHLFSTLLDWVTIGQLTAQQGDGDAALDHAVTSRATIGSMEMVATIETARTLRTCYTIFEAQGIHAPAQSWKWSESNFNAASRPENHRFFKQILPGQRSRYFRTTSSYAALFELWRTPWL